MYTLVTAKLAPLRRDEQGTVAILFASVLFALVLLLGCAIDIARAIHSKTKLASALDSAALAAAKSMQDKTLSTSDVKAVAERYFTTNLGSSGVPNFGQVSGFNVSIDRDKSTVTVSATANVPTTFARIGGIETIRMPGVAAAAFDPKDIEISLSLDVTGSMCQSCAKIESLQSAVRDMIDILLPQPKTSTNKVRVALAPFAAGVNAGGYADAASNRRARDGCVFERDGADQASDAGPGAGSYLKVAADPGVAATRGNCPSGSKVTPLSEDAGELKGIVDRLRTGGSTAGHLGTAWAWYLLSPKWASVWPSASAPAAYGDKRTIKAVVLMTDGLYNTFGGTNGSSQARDSQDLASRLCSSMKGEKVVVYTIGFMLDDRNAEEILRGCASSATTFFRAENREDLRTAFRLIAEDLLRLRLSQ